VVPTATGRGFICPSPEALEEDNALLPFQGIFKVFTFGGLHGLQTGVKASRF
jgi:hypothetical protein